MELKKIVSGVVLSGLLISGAGAGDVMAKSKDHEGSKFEYNKETKKKVEKYKNKAKESKNKAKEAKKKADEKRKAEEAKNVKEMKKRLLSQIKTLKRDINELTLDFTDIKDELNLINVEEGSELSVEKADLITDIDFYLEKISSLEKDLVKLTDKINSIKYTKDGATLQAKVKLFKKSIERQKSSLESLEDSIDLLDELSSENLDDDDNNSDSDDSVVLPGDDLEDDQGDVGSGSEKDSDNVVEDKNVE